MMNNKTVKTEFKEFVRDLTTEICRNVCLDQITTINREYKENTKNINLMIKNIENVIADNRNGIKEINESNNLELITIADNMVNILEAKSKALETLYKNNNDVFKEMSHEFDSVLSKIQDDEKLIKANSSLISELASTVKNSNSTLNSTLKTIEKNNLDYIKKLDDKNNKLINKITADSTNLLGSYEKNVQAINDLEREKFISSLVQTISSERDKLTDNIINDINSHTNYVKKDFSEYQKKLADKIDSILNGTTTYEKLDSLRKNNDKIIKEVQNINKNIGSISSNLSKILSTINDNDIHIKSKLNTLSKDLTNNITTSTDTLSHKIDEITTKLHNENIALSAEVKALQETIAKNNKNNLIFLAVIAIISAISIFL